MTDKVEAQLAQREGAKIVLTGAGRGLSITQRAAKKLEGVKIHRH